MLTEFEAWRLADAIMQGYPKITSRQYAYGFALQILHVLEEPRRDKWVLYRCNPGATRYLPLPNMNILEEIIEAYSQGAEVGASPPGSADILVFRPEGWPE